MINKTWFVAVKHAIQTQREEFSFVTCLNQQFQRLILCWIIHIKQIAQSLLIIIAASHVSLLFSHYFTSILAHEGALRNVLKRKESPHSGLTLCNPFNLYFKTFFIFTFHKEIGTKVFIATTHWVTLIKLEYFIYAICCSQLGRDSTPCFRTNFTWVRWILKFAIPFVTSAPFRVLAAIETSTKWSSLHFFLVLLYILIECNIFINVVP